jgi:hypothetical protein
MRAQIITYTACSERSAYSIASGASNSSYGNSSTATVSNEPTSLMSDDLMPEDFETGAYGNVKSKFIIDVNSHIFH